MLRLAASLSALASVAAGLSAMADSTLNVSEIVWLPEPAGVFLGSPTVVACTSPRNGSSLWLASHDFFGARSHFGDVFASADGGATWARVWASPPAFSQYWATLFAPSNAPPGTVYLFGVSDDGTDGKALPAIARSADCGETWSAVTLIPGPAPPYSTGPTPVIEFGGRLWRAFEHNLGAWASGYAAVMASAPLGADLLNASAWTLSPGLPFAAVAPSVPAAWNLFVGAVAPAWGWLEGNAVLLPGGAGVGILLRVNSGAAANKGALLRVPAPDAAPVLEHWVDMMPGGNTKFTVRFDAQSGQYVSLVNFVNVSDDKLVVAAPLCGPGPNASAAAALAAGSGAPPPAAPLPWPCCSQGPLLGCPASHACWWCLSSARHELYLAVSPDLEHWRVVERVLADDSALLPWVKLLYVGFQYVDFQLDGDDLLAVIRAGYRGADSYHNANRMLAQRITGWRARAAR